MKTIASVVLLFFAILTSCCTSDQAKPNGWYFIKDGVTDSVSSKPIVTASDFAIIQLDSGRTQDNKVIYQITGRIQDDKVEAFANATEKAIGQRIGFLYESEVICCPQVNARIESGNFAISSLSQSHDREKIQKIFEGLQKEMYAGAEDEAEIGEDALALSDITGFDSLFNAWEKEYRTKPETMVSSNTASAKELEQYSGLVRMGKKIIPLLITRLAVDDNFFALTLYDQLQDADDLKSFNYSQGEQYRTQETIRKYIENKLHKQPREFASDAEKIGALKQLYESYNWQVDTILNDIQRDSVSINLNYEVTEDFLKLMKGINNN